MWKSSHAYSISLLLILFIFQTLSCVHDQMLNNTQLHYLNDTDHLLFQQRLLQTTPARNKLRVFADYTQLRMGVDADKNIIKRIVNISANYFYNTLNVDRLSRLYFPANAPLLCNSIQVPLQYAIDGVPGDLGLMVANEDNNETYVARSTSCALLQSSNRPIWGVIIFNNRNLGYGQIQFQKLVYAALHELMHVIAFSSALFPLFPAGNPFIVVNDTQYISSPKLKAEISSHFNCSNPIGLPLEDQDGTLNSSHQERKVLGNEFMIAINKKQAFVSRFTLALLDSTGWYDVNYTFAEPTGWGKNKGCNFLNLDICSSEQFCVKSNDPYSLQLDCDWDGTAYGSCVSDPFAGSCNIVNYYYNTICIDDSYQTLSLTAPMKAKQKGGYNSKCFNSTFRAVGIVPNIINFRCYVMVCSSTGSIIYVRIDTYILICRTPGQILAPPIGMEGTLKCPNFKAYCQQNKKTCAFHCNKNGICINGMCLCTGSTTLTSTCIDQSNLTSSIGNTGGIAYSLVSRSYDDTISITNTPTNARHTPQPSFNSNKKQVTFTEKSINIKCMQGTYLDPEFKECVKCMDKFGCQTCTHNGCLGCVGNGEASCFMGSFKI